MLKRLYFYLVTTIVTFSLICAVFLGMDDIKTMNFFNSRIVIHAVSAVKTASSILIDGTAFNPTSLGEGSDVLPQREPQPL